MSESSCGCGCGSIPSLIYTCSGAADVGEISDQVGRKLSRDGVGKMTCLAGIGADLSGFIGSAKAARVNITIDGCPVACARKQIEKLGLVPESFVLTDLGLVKGKTPVEKHIIDEVGRAIQKTITGEKTNASCRETSSGNTGCCS
jgi:uncharacterized metal-binding protein